MKKVLFNNKKRFSFFLWIQKNWKFFVFVFFISVLLGVFINIHILFSAHSLKAPSLESLPKGEVVIVLGAKVYGNKRLSTMLADRVDTAIEIYQTGKVPKILVSGDNGQEDYDEVNTIKNYILQKDIPPEDIFLDHAGFDTYDSMYRARDIFGIRKAIVVTQDFHLPRTLYIANNLGMDIMGFPADKRNYPSLTRNQNREFLANLKAFWDVNFKSNPRFLGEKISISGDGQKSWDDT